MIALDASALLEQLLGIPKGQRVLEKYLVEGESFHIPHLLDLEVAQVLRRHPHRAYWPNIVSHKHSKIF